MQTKVRIVGESELGKKVAKCIEEHFEIKKREKFGTVPYRYATKMPLGCSIYITVKKEKTNTKPSFSFFGVISLSEDDIATLRREHREIKKVLSEVQKTTAFYQTRFGMADQVLTAIKKGSAKSPSFSPEFLRDPQYIQTIRNLCVQAIYSRWNEKKEPSTLVQIYYSVERKIQEMVNNRQWNTLTWKIPGRKTVDRRTEETASAKQWPKEPPCLCVRAGLYCPNPALFDDETKEQILKIAENWSDSLLSKNTVL